MSAIGFALKQKSCRLFPMPDFVEISLLGTRNSLHVLWPRTAPFGDHPSSCTPAFAGASWSADEYGARNDPSHRKGG
jgi:hypothetical protein